jgi:hypothetical protein
VAVIVQKISLSQAEERVHNFMARTKHARNVRHEIMNNNNIDSIYKNIV